MSFAVATPFLTGISFGIFLKKITLTSENGMSDGHVTKQEYDFLFAELPSEEEIKQYAYARRPEPLSVEDVWDGLSDDNY